MTTCSAVRIAPVKKEVGGHAFAVNAVVTSRQQTLSPVPFRVMTIASLTQPAVWNAAQLSERDDWLLELNENEIREAEVLRGTGELPEIVAPRLRERLLQVQDSLEHGSGACLIRGIDVSQWTADEAVMVFERLASVVGNPISQSAAGELIFHVRNEGFAEGDPRARGPNTKKKLSFHTDRCDVIGFLCLRQAKTGGDSQIVSSPAIFNEILQRRPDLLNVLMQPYRYQRHNVDTANALPYTEQPIFSIFQGHFAANFLRVLIERAYADPDGPQMTDEQREALDFLEVVAAEPQMHLTFRQQPGDILFLNNWVTLHRRTAFEDFDNPEQRRHILRVWLSMPNSRPIDPMFAGNYGATDAGAIRGGMQAMGSRQ